MTLEEMKRNYVLTTLAECGGNVSRCARRLGIARSSLQRMLRKYGFRSPEPPMEPRA